MKTIRTAIIGLGNIAHGYDDIPDVKKRMQYPTHLSVLKKDKRFALVAASDTSAAARREFRKKVPSGVRLYADCRAMFKKEDIELLVVAVPTNAHYKACSDAMRAGVKNILCEKPITRTVYEAEKLRSLSNRHGARILVNYQRSYSKDCELFAGLIRKKKWGPISSITVQYTNGVYNTATHLIHLLEKLFGPIRKVQSTQKNTRGVRDPNISFMALMNGFSIFFEGVDDLGYRLLEIDMKFSRERIVLQDDFFVSTSMRDVYENAYQVMVNGKKSAADLASAIHALAVAERAIASAKAGSIVTI